MDGKKGNIVNAVVAKLEADRRARRQQLERLAEQQQNASEIADPSSTNFAGSGNNIALKEQRSAENGHSVVAGSSSASSGMHSGSASPTAVAVNNGSATTTIITSQTQQTTVTYNKQYAGQQDGLYYQTGSHPAPSHNNEPAPVRPLRSKPVAEVAEAVKQQNLSIYPTNPSTSSAPSSDAPRHLSSSSSSSYMEHDQESFADEELMTNNASNNAAYHYNSATPLPARDVVVAHAALNSAADKISHSSMTSFAGGDSASHSSSRPVPPSKPPAQGRFSVTNVIAKQQHQSAAAGVGGTNDKIKSVRNAEEKPSSGSTGADYSKPEYASGNILPSSKRVDDFADKTRQMRLTQPIGLQALPYQVQRKVVNNGFRFNVLIIGETGLGKSTLLESLFNQEFDRGERVDVNGGPLQPRNGDDNFNNELHLEKFQFNLREGEVHLQLTCYETKNFGDQIDSSSSFDGIVSFIDKHYEAYLTEECRIERCMDNVEDTRIHLCVYLLPPTGRTLRQLDLQCLQALNDKLNIVPVIARADTFTADEVQLFKAAILQQLHTFGIHYMRFPLDWKEVKEDNITFDNVIPFAVVGSRTLEENELGRAKRVRRLPYGTIDIENLQHNDFKHLRDAILRVNTDYLIETTHSRHYEHFRQRKIQEIGLSVAKLKSEQQQQKTVAPNNAANNSNNAMQNKPKFIDVDLTKRFVMVDDPESTGTAAAAATAANNDANKWMIPTFVGVLINAVNYIDTPIQQQHLKSELEERWRPRAALVEQEMMQRKRKTDEEYRQNEAECMTRRAVLEQKRQVLEYEMQRLMEIRESMAAGNASGQHSSSNGGSKTSPHGNGSSKASTLKQIGGMGKKWRISNQ